MNDTRNKDAKENRLLVAVVLATANNTEAHHIIAHHIIIICRYGCMCTILFAAPA